MDDVRVRLAALVALLAVASLAWLWLRSRAGRVQAVDDGERLAAADLGADLGAQATFLQLSSPACAPCRSVARVLTEVVAEHPDVAHVEVDATERLDLARRLHVMRTPTVLVLDAGGRVVSRFSGEATRAQVLDTLPSPTPTGATR
ncbi:thioredoxin family protein [Spongisporangium articulatum]|uniref:Thioredoxin family protein n=1 Tax=Spongisporangium articulatum TaxID=3362603 RepID=A0ABW8AJQ9_9ACTN